MEIDENQANAIQIKQQTAATMREAHPQTAKP
jgi:hypothetical protein